MPAMSNARWSSRVLLIGAAAATLAAACASTSVFAAPKRALSAGQRNTVPEPTSPATDNGQDERTLPPEVRAALQRAGVPTDALSAVVLDAATGRRVLQTQASKPVNPASLMR